MFTFGKKKKIGQGYRDKAVSERQVDELIGICRGITADGVITQGEAEFIHKWLIANQSAFSDNPFLASLFVRVHEMLADGILDNEESQELLETLHHFSGGSIDLQEAVEGKIKATTLPFNKPEPNIIIPEHRFCFTGTFGFGTRNDCHQAIENLGGIVSQGVTKKLDYLVVGKYATDDWKHSTYGRKIEKAVNYRDTGEKVAIIGEDYWCKFLS